MRGAAVGGGLGGGRRRRAGAGLGLEHALGQHAGRVEAAAKLVGDEGGRTPVAVGQGHLQHAPGVPLQPPQPLLFGQALQLLQRFDQLLEVGLGQERFDLPLRHRLGPRHRGGREPGREAVGGAQLAARGGKWRAAWGGAMGEHGSKI